MADDGADAGADTAEQQQLTIVRIKRRRDEPAANEISECGSGAWPRTSVIIPYYHSLHAVNRSFGGGRVPEQEQAASVR